MVVESGTNSSREGSISRSTLQKELQSKMKEKLGPKESRSNKGSEEACEPPVKQLNPKDSEDFLGFSSSSKGDRHRKKKGGEHKKRKNKHNSQDRESQDLTHVSSEGGEVTNRERSKKRKERQYESSAHEGGPGKRKRLNDSLEKHELTSDRNHETTLDKEHLPLTTNRSGKKEGNNATEKSEPQEQVKKHVGKFLEHKEGLPIFQARNALRDIAEKNEIIILVGETGSGKTTQVPQFIAEWQEENKVVVTQPRRVAAVSVAKRVSEEYGSALGKDVGYKVRFEENYSRENTRMLFVTDGMLLREAQLDPLLKEWNWVILDEAHERTLHTDILFGIVKRALTLRKAYRSEDGTPLPQLKVIVMSATLEATSFSQFFFNAPILYVTGRQYPVDVYFAATPQKDYLESVVNCVFQIHLEEDPDGDILAFLTGQDEILALQAVIEEKSRFLPPEALKLMVFPLFAALPHRQQMQAFKKTPPGCRKLILSTNVAETSITIPGIKYVIDSGVVKAKNYLPDRGIEDLQVVPVSKASARQRTGRAGRERAGKCFRLYTEDQFETMEEFTVPEIRRSNLATVVLQMKSMGIDDILSFDFLDPPSKNNLENSLKFLHLLGALDSKGSITNIGKQMAKFPLDPMYSLTLLKSVQFGCTSEILSIISMLSVESIFYTPATQREEANKAKSRFTSRFGDHITYLYVYKAYIENKCSAGFCQNNFINHRNMLKVMDVRRQLVAYTKQLHIDPDLSCDRDLTSIRKCLLSGGFLHVAMRQPQSREFKTLQHNVDVKIHPSSCIQEIPTPKLPEFVYFNSLTKTSEFYIRDLTALDRDWLLDSELGKYFRGRVPMTVNDFEQKKAVKSANGSSRFRSIVSA